MKWTDVKPTRKGWYWYRNEYIPKTVRIVNVEFFGEKWRVNNASVTPVDDMRGEWSDERIEEPTE